MTGYRTVNLLDILNEVGENRLVENLRRFECPYNGDVEDFLHNKAITFAKQNLSSVWLVFASFKDEWRLVGYFALANKFLHIEPDRLKSNLRKSISKFATRDNALDSYVLAAPLIGQLGKNYCDGLDKLITGDELLNLACDKVREGQRIFGGKIVYLECEDVPALLNFYERNKFFIFARREPTREEKIDFKGKSLIQLMRYLK